MFHALIVPKMQAHGMRALLYGNKHPLLRGAVDVGIGVVLTCQNAWQSLKHSLPTAQLVPASDVNVCRRDNGLWATKV